MNLSASIVKAYITETVDQILEDLDQLEVVDAELRAFEAPFERVFPGISRVASGTDISGLLASLQIARTNLQKAVPMERAAADIVRHNPNDDIALEAYIKAQEMVKRLKDHVMITEKLVKKHMREEIPEELIQFANKVKQILRRDLPDWVSVKINKKVREHNLPGKTGVIYSIIFDLSGVTEREAFIDDETSKFVLNRGFTKKRVLVPHKVSAQGSIQMKTVGKPGVWSRDLDGSIVKISPEEFCNNLRANLI